MTRAAVIPHRWSADRLLIEMVAEPITAHHTDEAIVVEHLTQRGKSFLGVGEPPGIAGLLTRVHPEDFVHGAMIRGTWEHVPPHTRARFALTEVEDWDWMDIHHAPHAPGMHQVRELDPVTDRAQIDRVRHLAIPESFLRVDHPGSRWFGWLDEHGMVRAIGGAMGWDGASWPTGAHFGSIGTEPGWQGRGIGSALTAGMVGVAFREGALVASLGVHRSNTRAIEVYRRLGFTTTYQIHSRRRPSLLP